MDTTITEKGQVTIPVAVRRALGLKPRDRVRVEYDAERGVATLRPAPSRIADIYGAVTPRQRPEDFTARRAEFEDGIADDAMQRP
ncbi:MAG TPA: AbrB/MazE/SpoVT family DNA-binding domain-containing protein [Chloroflexota bacterium]|nr:AbrB/MazE/SpoVT family DNA-binding domain-containing protein [Chloroflexota bacterium]